jgi:predicted transcriptional regulator
MPTHDFTLIFTGDADAHLDALYDAGCDDALFGTIDGVAYADFTRDAPTFADAVRSAITAIDSIPGLKITRIEPDDVVTATEIARRLGRTRESVRLLIAGERGPGGFPAPISHTKDRFRLWRWTDILGWLGEADESELARARLTAAMNAAFELRNQTPELAARERKMVAAVSGRRH